MSVSFGRHTIASYSTSIATRPLYQPQLPHTTWGSLTELQRGHRLRAGVFSVQADARRLRLLDFDILRLGTAMRFPTMSSNANVRESAQRLETLAGLVRVIQSKLSQPCPPWIYGPHCQRISVIFDVHRKLLGCRSGAGR